jgi:hypothetical protein
MRRSKEVERLRDRLGFRHHLTSTAFEMIAHDVAR